MAYPPNLLYPMSLFNPFMLWMDVATKTMEMFISSGQVIGQRVDQMARAGSNPSPADIREFSLMGSEKLQAATESGLAVAARLQAQQMRAFSRAWGQWLGRSEEAARLTLTAMKPVHAKATANAKRLSGRKTRRSTRS